MAAEQIIYRVKLNISEHISERLLCTIKIRVNWIYTITIIRVHWSTITIRLFWTVPSQFYNSSKHTTTYPFDVERNHSRMEKGEWESSFWLGFEFRSSKWQERGLKGYGGGIYSFQPKNSRWAKGYSETPGNPDFLARKQHPDTPGNGVRSIRPYTRSIRVRQGKTSVYGSFEVFCGSQVFV